MYVQTNYKKMKKLDVKKVKMSEKETKQQE